MPATYKNRQDHAFLAYDNLSDCIANIRFWLNQTAGATTYSADAAATVPVTVKGASGQTGDLIDVKNSGGTVLFSVSSAGVPNYAVGATGSGSGATGTLPEIGTATGQQPLTQLSAGWVRINVNGAAAWVPYWQ
jgi:hypothetical protein